ncbi:MAG TPA: class I SAM-dependent methyltransferase [bacterium]|nr:class I SAM-dependent methyltransferase [bacterium]
MTPPFSSRRNLLNVQKEHWKPPVYSGGEGLAAKLKRQLFLLLDLQSGTIWRDMARELPFARGKVLDVGCGIQPFRHMFPTAVHYQGLDSIYSKEHFGYEAPDTLYYKGDRWPVRDRSVDFILCTETLEHIPEPKVFLKEAQRVLRPSGRILLTVPFAARWHFIPYDYWRYTPSGLERLLLGAGFDKVSVYARGNQLTVACYKIMAFIFSILLPVHPNPFVRFLTRVAGLISLPLLFAATALANLTLGIDGTVDCLGYTVTAERAGGAKVRTVKS